MFNNRSKSIKEIPSKEEGIKFIGLEIDNKIISNIESNGQIRVLDVEDATDDMIERWKKDYKESGLKFHEGQLLDQHDSQELYERIEELVQEKDIRVVALLE